jgi:hypothetical protein
MTKSHNVALLAKLQGSKRSSLLHLNVTDEETKLVRAFVPEKPL